MFNIVYRGVVIESFEDFDTAQKAQVDYKRIKSLYVDIEENDRPVPLKEPLLKATRDMQQQKK